MMKRFRDNHICNTLNAYYSCASMDGPAPSMPAALENGDEKV
jgi:hypothetical protein